MCGVLIWVYMLAKKILSHLDIGIHMLLFVQYIIFLIYINITVGFKKPTVMPVITVGLF